MVAFSKDFSHAQFTQDSLVHAGRIQGNFTGLVGLHRQKSRMITGGNGRLRYDSCLSSSLDQGDDKDKQKERCQQIANIRQRSLDRAIRDGLYVTGGDLPSTTRMLLDAAAAAEGVGDVLAKTKLPEGFGSFANNSTNLYAGGAAAYDLYNAVKSYKEGDYLSYQQSLASAGVNGLSLVIGGRLAAHVGSGTLAGPWGTAIGIGTGFISAGIGVWEWKALSNIEKEYRREVGESIDKELQMISDADNLWNENNCDEVMGQ